MPHGRHNFMNALNTLAQDIIDLLVQHGATE